MPLQYPEEAEGDWKVHKLSGWVKLAICRKVDKPVMKKYCGPGFTLGGLTAMEEMIWAQRR